MGDFDHGLQVGLETLYVHVDGSVESVTGTASGLAIGPFLGYKLTTDLGFTLDIQAGLSYLTLKGSASDGSTSAKGEEEDYVPIVNLNFGWSF